MEDDKQDEQVQQPAEAAGEEQDLEAKPVGDEVAELKALTDEYLAGWQRAKADYTNLKQEMDRLRQRQAKQATAATIKELIPVIDSFRKAAAARPDAGGPLPEQVRGWVEGIDNVRGQLEAALQRLGVVIVDQVGVEFDPALHEAVSTEKREEVEPGLVAEVVEPGYQLHDRLLRAAKVIVSA